MSMNDDGSLLSFGQAGTGVTIQNCSITGNASGGGGGYTTRTIELSDGYLGQVRVTIDGHSYPIAETPIYKKHASAAKAVLDLAKRLAS